MQTKLMDKSDALSSGKQFSKLRIPINGSSLIGFLFDNQAYVFPNKVPHKNVSVYYIGKFAQNKKLRDSVLVMIETKDVHIQWRLKLDDYVSGGVFDLSTLQIDIDNLVGLFGRNNMIEIVHNIKWNSTKLAVYVE